MSVTAILTAIGIFFVTDTDDLVVLLLLWLAAKNRQQRQQIIAGQYLGILSLIANCHRLAGQSWRAPLRCRPSNALAWIGPLNVGPRRSLAVVAGTSWPNRDTPLSPTRQSTTGLVDDHWQWRR